MIGIAQRFEARSVLSWNRFNMLIDERQYIPHAHSGDNYGAIDPYGLL